MFFEANVASSHFWDTLHFWANWIVEKHSHLFLILYNCDFIKYEEFIFMMINSWKNERKFLWKRRWIKKRLLRQKLIPLKRVFKRENWDWPPIYHLVPKFYFKFFVFYIMTTHLSRSNFLIQECFMFFYNFFWSLVGTY